MHFHTSANINKIIQGPTIDERLAGSIHANAAERQQRIRAVWGNKLCKGHRSKYLQLLDLKHRQT